MDETLSILIVEDEALIALSLKLELQRAGYPVCGTAMHGEEAITLANQKQPGAILMDIGLRGELDGFGVAEKILATWPVPILFISGYISPDQILRAEKYSKLPCLQKPVSIAQILRILEQLRPAVSD